MEQNTQHPPAMTATLSIPEWNFIMEVVNLVPGTAIKLAAVSLLKPQLDKQFDELTNSPK